MVIDTAMVMEILVVMMMVVMMAMIGSDGSDGDDDKDGDDNMKLVVILGVSVLDGVRGGSHAGIGGHGDDDKGSRACIGASMQLLLLSFSEYLLPNWVRVYNIH